MRIPLGIPESLQVLLNQVTMAVQSGFNVHEKAAPINGSLALPVVVELADFPEIDLAPKRFNNLDCLVRFNDRLDGNPSKDSPCMGFPDGLDPLGDRRRQVPIVRAGSRSER